MIKRKLIVFCLSIALLAAFGLVGSASALPDSQADPAAWEVLLLETSFMRVLQVTADGVQPLLDIPAIHMSGGITRIRATPDRRFVLFEWSRPAAGNLLISEIYVADISAGICCRQLEDPLNTALTVDWLGPISPDGTQVAISAGSQSIVNGEQQMTPLVQVFDIETGLMAASMTIAELQSEFSPPAAAFGAWKADGIRVMPSCIGCEGVWQGHYQIWNPVTGTLSPPQEPFDAFRETLSATGEQLKDTEDWAFPTSGALTNDFPAPNVVQYYADAYAPGQIIFFDPNSLYIEHVEWVWDGNAIVISLYGPPVFRSDGSPGFNWLGPKVALLRNGQQIELNKQLNGSFLVGTPDGWLGIDHEADTLIHNQILSDGSLTSTVIGNVAGGGVWVIDSNFELGQTANGSFPVVSPPTPVTCPGFMVSRLAKHSIARVTPGSPNNIRAEASTSTALVGEIPGEALFIVLDGPVCAENMAWWQVDYNGVIGWTSEGQGSAYWLEPNMGFN
ncbi:MAG: SH3 domain-containing protein [Anaerolineae bacterium]|nr:SH3 domain-containing protein [Anaerolineae bacterium]